MTELKVDKDIKFVGLLLGNRSRFLLEPLPDLTDISSKDGSRLLDITPEEENNSTHTSNSENEICQSHRSKVFFFLKWSQCPNFYCEIAKELF